MLAESLNTDAAQHVAEIILAVLLFIDATDIRGGLFGSEPRAAMRDVLNVEAGYNDGIVSPVFIFALALAGENSHAATPVEALGAAVPQAIKAILVGVAVGGALALLTNIAERHGEMPDQSKRLILVAAPMLSYGLSLAAHGNGFVSAFVCGIAFHYLSRSEAIRGELELLDDIGFLLSAGMWFVFGATVVLALTFGVSWQMVLFRLLALTAVRLLPVLVAMLGSAFTWPERLMVGWLRPRGTTSIVFGLLAFNVLAGDDEQEVLMTMVIAVLASVVLHGVGAPAAARAYRASQTRLAG